MKTLFGFFAIALLATPLVAQDLEYGTLENPPTYLGTYDLATQTMIPSPPPPGVTSVYCNDAINNSFFGPGAGIINMDWGTLSAGGANDIVEFEVGYATVVPDIPAGPVGFDFSINTGAPFL